MTFNIMEGFPIKSIGNRSAAAVLEHNLFSDIIARQVYAVRIERDPGNMIDQTSSI